jgi:hypothetical protein
MALQKSIETEYGIICSQCYLVVEQIFHVKNEKATGELVGYATKQSRDDGYKHCYKANFAFTFDVNSTDGIVKQAYEAIKTLPQFQGAIDV